MKKLLLVAVLALTLSVPVFAQGMMQQSNIAGLQNAANSADTANDEAKGKAIWDKLQLKQTDCKSLVDDDFDVLGDYFMGLMMGNNHASMNSTMTQNLGEDGEKQMHVAMGKRLSGCDTAAILPSGYQGFYPTMMGGSQMMNWDGASESGIAKLITMVLSWTLMVLAIVGLWKYLGDSKKK